MADRLAVPVARASDRRSALRSRRSLILARMAGPSALDVDYAFAAALTFAQRARAAAAIFLRAAALIVRFFGPAFEVAVSGIFPFSPRTLAHRARAASAMRRLPSALILRLLG